MLGTIHKLCSGFQTLDVVAEPPSPIPEASCLYSDGKVELAAEFEDSSGLCHGAVAALVMKKRTL